MPTRSFPHRPASPSRVQSRAGLSVAHAVAVLATLIGGSAFLPTASAQLAPPDPFGPVGGTNVFLPAPRDLTQRLSRAEAAIAAKEYADAVIDLGDLLADPSSEDYFTGRVGDRGTRTSIKTAAQRLIANLPPAARETFELRYGSDARRQLAAAVEDRDLEGITAVARSYFHTAAGYDATMLLGRVQLDRGQPLAAAGSFRRLLAATEKYEPTTSILATVALLDGGLRGEAEAVLADLKRRRPDVTITTESGPVPLFADGESLTERLTKVLGPTRQAGLRIADAWAMFRGGPDRNAITEASLPLLTYRFQTPIVKDAVLEDELVRRVRETQATGSGTILSVSPVVVGRWVLMRSSDRIYGIDRDTGRRIWDFPWDGLEMGRPQPTDPMGRIDGGLTESAKVYQRLVEDNAYGQIASDGENVYFLDEVGYDQGGGAFNQQLLIARAGGFGQPTGEDPSSNKLVSLDLAAEGRLRWIVGGADGTDEPALAGVTFLGPPLPLQGQLFVIGERGAEVRLFALDAATGAQIWTQQLAQADELALTGTRRLGGATPSFGNGVLVCPTGVGAVVAVDLATRSLLWGHPYPNDLASGGRRILSRNSGPPEARWADAAATIVGNVCLLTPPESQRLIALDLTTGAELWKPLDRDNASYLAGVFDGKIVLVGGSQLAAIDLSSGRTLWTVSSGEDTVVTGRGFGTKDGYYLPMSGNVLSVRSLDDGREVSRATTQAPLGNLVAVQGELFSLDPGGLTVYRLEGSLREEVVRRLADDPEDAWAIERQAELAIRDGEADKAFAALEDLYRRTGAWSTRTLLIKVALLALADDPAASVERVRPLEGLFTDVEQRETYLRLMATGYLEIGQPTEAFEMIVPLLDLPEPRSLTGRRGADPPTVAPRLKMSRGRWIAATIRRILDQTPSDQAATIRAKLDALIERADAEGNDAVLETLWSCLALESRHDDVWLRQTDRLLEGRDYLAAEQKAIVLTRRGDPATVTEALTRLASIYGAAGRTDAAATAAGLAEAVRGGATLDALTTAAIDGPEAAPHLPAFETGMDWPTGDVDLVLQDSGLTDTQRYLARQWPIDASQTVGPVQIPRRLIYDGQGSTVAIRDRFNRPDVEISLVRPNVNTSYISAPWNTTSRLWGHLAVITAGTDLVALDTLRTDLAGSDGVLWREDFVEIRDRSGPAVAGVSTSPRSLPLGVTVIEVSDPVRSPFGSVGEVTDHGVPAIVRDQLILFDPLTGRREWVREGITRGSTVFGDEELVFVLKPGATEATAFHAFDGTAAGVRPIAQAEKRWLTRGRNVLTCVDQGGQVVVTLAGGQFSPDGDGTPAWQDQPLLTRTVPSGSRAVELSDDRVAIVSPPENGIAQLLVFSLRSGDVLTEMPLTDMPSVQSIAVCRFAAGDLLLMGRVASSNRPGVVIDAPIRQSYDNRPLEGALHFLDRATSKPRWPIPATVPAFFLPTDQPLAAPAVLLMRRLNVIGNRSPRQIGVTPSSRQETEFVVFDLRDGRSIFAEDGVVKRPINNYTVVAEPETKTWTLRVPDRTVRLEFTDRPRPPSPPTQIREPSDAIPSAESGSPDP